MQKVSMNTLGIEFITLSSEKISFQRLWSEYGRILEKKLIYILSLLSHLQFYGDTHFKKHFY